MMNIKIGRDLDSDILLSHAKASRNHALLTISAFGKMTLTDLSANGTSVNGSRLQQGLAYVVTREDEVTFADGTEYLDWSTVPNRRRTAVLWSSSAAVLILVAALLLGWHFGFQGGPAEEPEDEVLPVDTLDEKDASDTLDEEAEDTLSEDAVDEDAEAAAAQQAQPAASAPQPARRVKATKRPKPAAPKPAAPKASTPAAPAQPAAAPAQPASTPAQPASPAPAKKKNLFIH